MDFITQAPSELTMNTQNIIVQNFKVICKSLRIGAVKLPSMVLHENWTLTVSRLPLKGNCGKHLPPKDLFNSCIQFVLCMDCQFMK